MDELDRHFERQMRSQERQLVGVRLTLAAVAAVLLVGFNQQSPTTRPFLVLVGAVVVYTLVLWWLIGRFPAREIGIVATALDLAAVTVAVYIQPQAIDGYLFYGVVILGAALRFGLGASIWSAIVCAGLYGTVILLSGGSAQTTVQLLPVRIAYLLGIGLAVGLYAQVVLGRASQVARLQTRLEQEEREQRRAREEALLSQLAHDFSSSLERDATVGSIVRSTGDLMGDLAELWLVDEDHQNLALAGVVARDQDLQSRAREHALQRTPRIGEGVIGRAAATATSVLIGPSPPPLAEAGDPDGIDSLGLRSLLAVPIIGRGQVRGVLVAASVGGALIGEGERRLAEAIAERAGPALENAALWADLQEQMAREHEAQRVKDDFLSIVSHELRTPLTSITGYAQLLERRLRDRQEETKELDQLRVIREQSGRMRRLVEDLLDVSRIDRRGGVSIEPERIDLAEELRAVVARTERAHPDRRVELEAPETLQIEADRDRIGQVLTNLADNAAKYSPEVAPIRISARRDGDEVEMRVSDEGVGIPDELRERVFDLFVQGDGDASKRRFGGLGLGLYITRAIVDAHGGRVWAEPNRDAGRGTVVFVRLPVRARMQVPASQPALPGEPPPFVVRRPSR
jgi:K+-sensing histidine kinase KdpD